MKISSKRLSNKEIKKARLKFNPGLELIGLWTTGPRTIGYTEQGVCFSTVGLGHVRQGGHTHLPPEDATRALHWLNVAAHYHHALVAVLEDDYTQVN